MPISGRGSIGNACNESPVHKICIARARKPGCVEDEILIVDISILIWQLQRISDLLHLVFMLYGV